MCTQKPPNDYSEQLYTRYRDSFSLYISEKACLLLCGTWMRSQHGQFCAASCTRFL
jgi:hypothetical protein